MHKELSIQNLLAFLNHSPTPWHAVDQLLHDAKNASFELLDEGKKWLLKPGKAYVVERDGSSFAAFIMPNKRPKKIRLIASHTDSPSLKLKPKPEIYREGMLLFAVELYGSPLLNAWLNCDLGIAGRVTYLNQSNLSVEKVIRLDEFPLIIPQLAIHLEREINEKGLILNKQDHLNALVGLIDETEENQTSLESLISSKIKDFKKLLTHDLFLFPLEKAKLIGFNYPFIASYRIDNLQSVFAAFEALLHSRDALEDEIKMVIFWNHEEIGSNSCEGAQSPFFNQIAERISLHDGMNREDLFILLHQSTCLSVDLAHAVHPNYIEKHDPNHRLKMGGGVVIKTNALQRYATSSRNAAPLHLSAEKLGLSLQEFVSRNDLPCGSTIGPLHASLTGMKTLDIGCAQLAMHSSREVMAVKDHLDLIEILKHFLNS